MSKRQLVGICGLMGSGKSTVAERLVKTHGYRRRPFAGPLKDMMRMLLFSMGASSGEVHAMVDGADKEKPTYFLGGNSPRKAMQTLGTEWGRALHSDFWLNAWGMGLKGDKIVVDDLRFPNEAAHVRSMGGKVLKVLRAGVKQDDHVSESYEIDPDFIITNDGSIDELCKMVDLII